MATKPARPEPGDWLAVYPEKGQTFKEYLVSNPIRPTETRNTLYIQPLGNFTAGERRLVKLTAEVQAAWFGLPVKFSEDLKLDVVPPAAGEALPTASDLRPMLKAVARHFANGRPRVPEAATGS